MDPISVAASIVGLLGAAATVSSLLVTLIETAKGAPKWAKNVLLEVNAVSVCLTQLQDFISESSAHRRSQRKLVLVEQIVVTLTECMMTFADLEKIASTMQGNRPLLGSIRIRWAWKEKVILKLLAQLQNSKASLNLMLAILTCTSFEEAQTSVTQLTSLVEQALGKNEEMSRRLETLEIRPSKGENLILSESRNAGRSEGRDKYSAEVIFRRTRSPSPSFEQDLYASPVYARTMDGGSNLSVPLSTRQSNARSYLSNLSLADVSNMSILSLPITTAEIWNGHHYLIDHHRTTEAHASARESRFAMAQDDSISQTKEKVKASFDKIQGAGNTRDEESGLPDKIMLLGISLSGKTTVFRQLQNLYGGGFTSDDRVEARAAILSSLLGAFQGAWSRIRYIEDDFEDDAERLLNYFEVVNYSQTNHQLYDFYNPDLLQALTQLWQHRGVRRTLTLNHKAGLGDDATHIMKNIDDLLNPDYILSDEEVLRARIQTVGALNLSVDIKNFEYKFLDVGGVRSERCKWDQYYSQVNHIFFVISLPGYYQYLVEDNETTQMKEALRTFKALTEIELLQNMPITLLLNKTDLFMEHLDDIPISNYFLDFEGGSNYHLACQYFAQRFRKLDQRKNGKLFFFLTNAADADSFRLTFRNLRLTALRETLALQSFR